MLTAIRASDQKLVAGQSIRKRTEEKYYCPECGAEVIHHKSAAGVVIGHFKHRSGTTGCSLAGESLLHLQTKAQILEYLRREHGNAFRLLEAEYRGLGPELRPDIFLLTQKGTRIAIEVQVSDITVDEMTRRFKAYSQLRIYLLWVLPFEAERFSVNREEYGWTHGQGKYIRKTHQETARQLRLTEAEVFLYWAGFKRLVFWDSSTPFDSGFILCHLQECFSSPREVMVEGEIKKWNASKLSMVKNIDLLEMNIPFRAFTPSRIRAFRSKMRPYPIPARLMMLPRERKAY